MSRLKYEFKHLELSTDVGFDGAYYEFPVEGGDDIVLDFSFNQDLELEKGLSNSIVAYGAAGDYVRYWLVEHPNAPLHTILVKITDTACDRVLGEWLVETANLTWCHDSSCKYIIRLKEYDPSLDCLKNTLIYDNHQEWFPDDGFPTPGTIHPRFRYCDDIKPQALQNFVAVIAQGVLIAFNSVVGPISVIVSVLTALSVVPSSVLDTFNDIVDDVYEGVFGWFLGCRRLHPSPFVRTYMQNVCDKCGLTFTSSILNDSGSNYYNLAHLYAPTKYGVLQSSSKDWIPQNAPIYSLWSYAKSLRNVFNAKYTKRDGQFIFERRDYFEGTFIFDFRETGGDYSKLDGSICFTWTGEKKPAYRSFKYSDDAFDQTGNEAKHRFNDNTYFLSNPLFGGVKEVAVTDYAPQRYTEDGIDQRLIFDALVTGSGFPSISTVEDVLLMSSDITSSGKLIEYDTTTSISDARTIKCLLTDFDLGVYDPAWNSDWVVENASYTDRWVYNYHMIYDDRANVTYQNLSDFWSIEDSNNTNRKDIEFTLSIRLCCDSLALLLFTNPGDTEMNVKIDYKVYLTDDYNGAIQGVNVDYKRNLITLKGIVI